MIKETYDLIDKIRSGIKVNCDVIIRLDCYDLQITVIVPFKSKEYVVSKLITRIEMTKIVNEDFLIDYTLDFFNKSIAKALEGAK